MNERPELRDWLRPLEPPPGGVAGLRRRLARRDRRRAAARGAAAALVLVALIAAGALTLREVDRERRRVPDWARNDLMAVELGLVEAPSEPVSVPPAERNRLAVAPIPTRDARVVMYLVGSR